MLREAVRKFSRDDVEEDTKMSMPEPKPFVARPKFPSLTKVQKTKKVLRNKGTNLIS